MRVNDKGVHVNERESGLVRSSIGEVSESWVSFALSMFRTMSVGKITHHRM